MNIWIQGPIREVATGEAAEWAALKIGGGGYLVGMDVHNDGSVVVRADTYGAYLLDGNGKFQQIVTSQSMPAGHYGPDLGTGAMTLTVGVYDIRFDPQNSSIMWMHYAGRMYRSTNKGATWTHLSNYARDPGNATFGYQLFGPLRTAGQTMAIDPNNSDVCYVGVEQTGVRFTLDAGATWSLIPTGSIVTGGDLYNGIVFDTSNGTTGGRTNNIYISRRTTGVYRTTDAGANWTLLNTANMPLTVGHARVSGGSYYCAGSAGSTTDLIQGLPSIFQYNGTAWSVFRTDPVVSVSAFDFDPNDANHIVYMSGFGAVYETLNLGGAWTERREGGSVSETATDIPWLANTGNLSVGEVWFDRVVDKKLWLSHGVGVSRTTTIDPVTDPVVFVSQTNFIENLVATKVIKPPGFNALVGCQDRQMFRSLDDGYPSTFGLTGQTSIVHCYAIDYGRSSSPGTVVALNTSAGSHAISSNGGLTWGALGASPGAIGSGAAIAISSSTNFVACLGNGATNLRFTTNGGGSWGDATGLSGSALGGSVAISVPLCADAVTAGTFYVYDLTVNRVYKSTNSGANWAQSNAATLDGTYEFITQLVPVLGKAGHLLYTSGPDLSGSARPENPLYLSEDAGVTFNALTDVEDVVAVGVSAQALAGSYPTIYVQGWADDGGGFRFGIHRSIDKGATWTYLVDYPNGWIDNVSCMCGNPDNWQEVFLGFQGSGWMHYG